MKNIITKNPLLSIIIVIALLIIGGLVLSGTDVPSGSQNGDGSATSTATSTKSSATTSGATSGATSGTQSSGTQTAPKANTPVSTKPTGTSLPITVSKSVNEDEYIRQLQQNQRTCEQLAEKQFNAIYSYLQAANFKDYYTTSGGKCYSQVFGQTRQQYATSTTGHIFLRDVLVNTLLAECTSPTGGLVTDPQWSCTIKSSGQKLDKMRFDEYFNNLLK